jgi:hypothetical protein
LVKGGATEERLAVLAFGGGKTGTPARLAVCAFSGADGSDERLPVFAFSGVVPPAGAPPAGAEGADTEGKGGTVGAGFAGTPTRNPEEELELGVTGGVIGVDFVLVGAKEGLPISSGWVTASEAGITGKSTRRSDAVGRLTWTGVGVPSGVLGRPGEATTPEEDADGGETGSVGFLTVADPLGGTAGAAGAAGGGAPGAGELKTACGATGSGVRGVGTLVMTGSGGGVAVEELGWGAAVIVGKDCVAGSAGGRAWCGMGVNDSPSSTFPLCTKTLAFALATTTRGGDGTFPEGVEAGSEPEFGFPGGV